MKFPSLLSIKKPCQEFDRSCKNTDRSTSFGKLPADVNAIPSRSLKPTGKLVFCALADEAKGTNRSIRLSDSALAKKCGISRPSVLSALRTLCGLKLVERDGDPIRQIQAYRITHYQFPERVARGGQKQPEQEAKVAPELARCPKCGKAARGLLKVGWCRSCNWHLKIARIVDERIAAHGAETEARKTA